MENAKIQKIKGDILSNFQTMWVCEIPFFGALNSDVANPMAAATIVCCVSHSSLLVTCEVIKLEVSNGQERR